MNKWIAGFLIGCGLFLLSPRLLNGFEAFFLLLAIICLSVFNMIDGDRNKKRKFARLLVLIGLLTGAFWQNLYSNWYFQDNNLSAAIESQEPVFLTGRIRSVITVPIILRKLNSGLNPASNVDAQLIDYLTFEFKVEHAGKTKNRWYEPKQILKVNAYNLHYKIANQLKMGTRLRIKAKVKRVSGFENEYGFNAKQLAVSKGLFGKVTLVNNESITVLDDSEHTNIEQRQNITDAIFRNANSHQKYKIEPATELPNLGFLIALITGDRQFLDQNDKTKIRALGVGHLLAISGLHIGLIFVLLCGAIRLALQIIVRVTKSFTKILSYLFDVHVSSGTSLFPSRIPFYLIATSSLTMTWSYIALIGFPPSAIRAGLVILLWTLIKTVSSNVSALVALLWIAFISVVYDSYSFLNMSWWLSFYAVFGIILFFRFFGLSSVTIRLNNIGSPYLNKTIMNTLVFRWLSLVIVAVVFQIFIFIWMLPISTFFFSGFSGSSILTNFLIAPVFALIIMPSLFVSVTLLSIAPETSFLFMSIADHSLTLMFRVFEKLVVDDVWIDISSPQLMLGVFIFLSILLCLVTGRQNKMPFVLIFSFFIGKEIKDNPNQTLRVFDVGQGSSALLTEDEKALVIDLGPVYKHGGSATHSVIKPNLIRLGIDNLDTVLLTHLDSDHIGDAKVVEEYLQKQPEHCDNISNLPTLNDWPNTRFSLLWPDINRWPYLEEVWSTLPRNDKSCVVLIEWSRTKTRILITGDISEKVERLLVDAHYEGLIDLDVDVLLSPHHGSKYSSSRPFIYATKPEHVIHSVGVNNRFKMPAHSVVDKYSRYRVNQHSTAKFGQITVSYNHRLGNLSVEHQLSVWTPFWKKQNPFSFHGQIR